MATDKWLEFNGVEIVNLSRSTQLAEAMGIDTLWTTTANTDWIETARGGDNYGDVTNAPWYDPQFPASAEFAGVVTLGFPGLDDSTTESSTTEYVTSGGRSGRQRNSTLPIVASVALIASTDRGAEYGKRWLDRTLRGSASRANCAGADLRYYRYADASAPVAHRRQVRLTRGTSVTRKRTMDCSTTWLATFTLTCDDPFEYGQPIASVSSLGGPAPTGTLTHGELTLIQQACPAYDYSPVYDPLYPALVSSPTAPNLLPTGWAIEDGMEFKRYWARVSPPEPSSLNVVPFITLTTDIDVRTLRVSVWPDSSLLDDQCGPLYSAVVTFVPGDGSQFYLDGEQQAAYLWDGASPVVRRADSLVFSPTAMPVEWAAFNDEEGLLITLDIVEDDGLADVEMSLAFIPKSD